MYIYIYIYFYSIRNTDDSRGKKENSVYQIFYILLYSFFPTIRSENRRRPWYFLTYIYIRTYIVLWKTAAAVVAATAVLVASPRWTVSSIKLLVRPPQVITSARPELGFLPARRHHATGTSGIPSVGSSFYWPFCRPDP